MHTPLQPICSSLHIHIHQMSFSTSFSKSTHLLLLLILLSSFLGVVPCVQIHTCTHTIFCSYLECNFLQVWYTGRRNCSVDMSSERGQIAQALSLAQSLLPYSPSFLPFCHILSLSALQCPKYPLLYPSYLSLSLSPSLLIHFYLTTKYMEPQRIEMHWSYTEQISIHAGTLLRWNSRCHLATVADSFCPYSWKSSLMERKEVTSNPVLFPFG